MGEASLWRLGRRVCLDLPVFSCRPGCRAVLARLSRRFRRPLDVAHRVSFVQASFQSSCAAIPVRIWIDGVRVRATDRNWTRARRDIAWVRASNAAVLRSECAWSATPPTELLQGENDSHEDRALL